MPEFDLEAVRARQAAAREALADEAQDLTRADIDACPLCDDDGYRNRHVCDHQDHAQAAARGMTAIRAILGNGGAA